MKSAKSPTVANFTPFTLLAHRLHLTQLKKPKRTPDPTGMMTIVDQPFEES